MKISIKDYLMIIVIIIITIIWLLIIENTKYNNEKSLINKKYCLDEFKDSTRNAISSCNHY